jgi:hypothetical protein
MDIATGQPIALKGWGINQEVTITVQDISRLIQSKSISFDAGVILLLMLDLGSEYVLSGGEFFAGEGDLCKFALSHNLEPEKVQLSICKLKTAEKDLSKLSMPTQLNIPYSFE